MLASFLYAVVRLLLDLALLRCHSSIARDVELLALRHEVRVLRRRTKRIAWRPGERLVLTALSRCLPRAHWLVFPVRPETLLRWHRELIRRQWALFGRRRGLGRPPLPIASRNLIPQLAQENPRWGYQRIRGELLKLGRRVSGTTIRSLLRRHGIPPEPWRAGVSWRAFLRAHAAGALACDFFPVGTLRLHTVFVLLFIELQTRQVFVAGCTEHPSAARVTQQACHLVWQLEDDSRRPPDPRPGCRVPRLLRHRVPGCRGAWCGSRSARRARTPSRSAGWGWCAGTAWTGLIFGGRAS